MTKLLKYPVAQDATGQIVLITDDPIIPPFTCIGCGNELIARRGSQRVRHFAHKSGYDGPCPEETALHRAAKELIRQGIEARLAQVEQSRHPYLVEWRCCCCYETHSYDLMLRGQAILVEATLDTIRPDLLLLDKHNNPSAAIEVIVSHPPEGSTLAVYRQRGIPVFFISPTWDTIQTLRDGLTLSAILAKETACKHVRDVRKLQATYQRAVDVCRAIPSNPKAHEQCGFCQATTFSYTMTVYDHYECYVCRKMARVALIDYHWKGIKCIKNQFVLNKLGEQLTQWQLQMWVDHSHMAEKDYLMNHCQHCQAKLGSSYFLFDQNFPKFRPLHYPLGNA